MRQPSPKQRRFCHEYIIDYNGRAALLRAGYTDTRSTSTRILQKDYIKAYLATLIPKQLEKLDLTAQRVLDELAKVAFIDPGVYFKRDEGDNVVMKDIDELTPEQRAAVCEYDHVAKKFKLSDKLTALDKLGKHFKLFTELHEQLHTFTIMGNVKIGGKDIEFNVGQKPPERS